MSNDIESNFHGFDDQAFIINGEKIKKLIEEMCDRQERIDERISLLSQDSFVMKQNLFSLQKSLWGSQE